MFIDHPVLNFEITKTILKNILLKELIQLENKETYDIRKELEVQTKSNAQTIASIESQII